MTVCDLCGSDQFVHWEWETPNPASSLEEARKLDVVWFEDPIWHLCDTCHRMVLANRPHALLERGISLIEAAQKAEGVAFAAVMRDGVLHRLDINKQATDVHSAFWEHKTTHRRIA